MSICEIIMSTWLISYFCWLATHLRVSRFDNKNNMVSPNWCHIVKSVNLVITNGLKQREKIQFPIWKLDLHVANIFVILKNSIIFRILVSKNKESSRWLLYSGAKLQIFCLMFNLTCFLIEKKKYILEHFLNYIHFSGYFDATVTLVYSEHEQ